MNEENNLYYYYLRIKKQFIFSSCSKDLLPHLKIFVRHKKKQVTSHFYHWSKLLYLSLSVQPEIQILNEYCPFFGFFEPKFDFESICSSAASGEGLRIFALIPPLYQQCSSVWKFINSACSTLKFLFQPNSLPTWP